jgi:hypothetical protein
MRQLLEHLHQWSECVFAHLGQLSIIAQFVVAGKICNCIIVHLPKRVIKYDLTAAWCFFLTGFS